MPLAVDDEEALARGQSPAERRLRGAFFTPHPLVTRVFDQLAPLLPTDGRLLIVDPAAGAGAFLSEARRRYPRAQLVGLELDAHAVAVCRARLGSDARAHVRQGDALVPGQLEAVVARHPADFTVMLGNPPYNGASALLHDPARWAAVCALLPEGLHPPPGTSLRDDYAFFLLEALAVLRRRPGALAFITSATLLDAFHHRVLREALLRELHLRAVEDFGAHAFHDAHVHTCLTVWTTAATSAPPRWFDATHDEAFTPAPPELCLRPLPEAAAALDARWRAEGEPLDTLVPVSFPGLKTRFDELLVDDDAARLEARVAAFLSTPEAGLPAFAARWGLKGALEEKLVALKRTMPACTFDPRCVRPFHRYHGAHPRLPVAHCYLERALIPRGDHRLRGDFDPHREPLKLVFNLHELPLWAQVFTEPGCVTAYRHARFAPARVPAELLAQPSARHPGGPLVPNLSPRALALGSPAELYPRLERFIRSHAVQQVWAPAFGTTRVLPVPMGALRPRAQT
jgi:hypothetical protein